MAKREYIQANKDWLAETGYGKFSQPGISGGSTLIFENELLGIA